MKMKKLLKYKKHKSPKNKKEKEIEVAKEVGVYNDFLIF